MTELKLFERKEFGSVRVVMIDGTPWFVASDIARALGYERPNDAVNAHCKKVNKFSYGESPQGARPYNIIPESDVYRLVMRSNLPSAVQFQDWVVEEILPALRKDGFYGSLGIPDFSDPVAAARAWADKEEERRMEQGVRLKLQAQLEEMQPKILFADSVAASASSILVGQFANLLRQNGIPMGQNRLFEWLRGHGFLIQSGSRRNCPTQRGMEMGLFEVKERTISNPDGSIRITLTTKITGRGQIYFLNRFTQQGTGESA